MATELNDMSSLLEGIPPGAWVAISEAQHKVISFGADVQAVARQSAERGEDQPLIVRVPDQPSILFL